MNSINWADPKYQVSTHFTVSDCLNLPTWGRLANESDGLNDEIKHNLINLCAKMEGVRAFLGNQPMRVHCMYRPPMYNKLIGGATHSVHMTGEAIDFDVFPSNEGCDSTREALLPKLGEFELRMEDVSEKANRNWVHLDTSSPHPSRYFKP